MADVFEERAKILKAQSKPKDPFEERAKVLKTQAKMQTIPGKDLGESFLQGLRGSSAGQVFGYKPTMTSTEAPLSQSLAQSAGTMAGDVPAMTAGGALGSLVGGPIGAAAGAFMAPEFVKQVQEYRRKPKRKSWVDSISDIAHIPWETGKHGVIGAATGIAGKLAPLIKFASPVVNRIAKTAVGEALVKGAAEFGGMTAGQSAVEGKLPSLRGLAENAILLGGMKGAGLAAKGVTAITPEPIKAKISSGVEKVTELGKKAIPKIVPEKIEQYKKSKAFYGLLREHIGTKNRRIVESQFKWRDALDNAQEKHGESFIPKELEEAMYYRQRTGNPFIKGDTFEKLEKRVPESLQHTVDNEIDKHFETTRAEMNKHPFIKDVNPRENVVQRYMPGMYEDSKNFGKVYDQVARQMKYKNPFADMKTFLNYQEAFEHAGLKPRFKNIFQMMEAYDKTLSKTIAGGDLLQDISKIQKTSPNPIVVTSRTPRAYKLAEESGLYTPFEDFTLRKMTKNGVTPGKPTLAPALVANEAAGAFNGIFSKKAFKPTNPTLKFIDTLGDMVRGGRVMLSFFHFVPLTESSAGALGARKAFRFRNIARQGEILRSDPEFMADAAQHNLEIKGSVERYERTKALGEKIQEKADKLTDAAIDLIPEKAIPTVEKAGKIVKGAAKPITKPLRMLAKAQKYLFEKYHPNLKAVTWKHFVDKSFEKLIAEGKPPSAVERTKIKRDMADLTNALYGGQNWEIQRVFNTPEYRAWLRRAIGYPDWTMSAVKQAANVFSGGLKGEQARKYWIKFGLNSAVAHAFLQFTLGGFEQKNEKNKSKYGIDLRWSPNKALKSVTSPDPLEWFKFPLPDINVRIAGHEFNPSRDAGTEWKKKGNRLYAHFGKQALEIKDEMYHPFSTLMTKSNPLIQMAYKQLVGSFPSKRDAFAVQSKYNPVTRKWDAWQGTKSGTAGRVVSRAKQLVEDVAPFSMHALKTQGVAPFLATAGGSVPISKGTTPYKAEPELIEAFKKNDIKLVKRIRVALRDNGYSELKIARTVNEARKQAKL